MCEYVLLFSVVVVASKPSHPVKSSPLKSFWQGILSFFSARFFFWRLGVCSLVFWICRRKMCTALACKHKHSKVGLGLCLTFLRGWGGRFSVIHLFLIDPSKKPPPQPRGASRFFRRFCFKNSAQNNQKLCGSKMRFFTFFEGFRTPQKSEAGVARVKNNKNQ